MLDCTCRSANIKNKVFRIFFPLITDTFDFFGLMYLWFSLLAKTCIKGESRLLHGRGCSGVRCWAVVCFRLHSIEALPSRLSFLSTAGICNSHCGIFFRTEHGQGPFPLEQKRYELSFLVFGKCSKRCGIHPMSNVYVCSEEPLLR